MTEIGELCATYLFETPAAAKAAWERAAAKNYRGLTINRWAIPNAALHLVTIMSEKPNHERFEQACAEMTGGVAVASPPGVRQAFAAKRARNTEPRSSITRTPLGLRVHSDGSTSPYRRPQG